MKPKVNKIPADQTDIFRPKLFLKTKIWCSRVSDALWKFKKKFQGKINSIQLSRILRKHQIYKDAEYLLVLLLNYVDTNT